MSILIDSGSIDIAKAAGVYEAVRASRPATKKDLLNYIKVFLGISVPDKRICNDHCSPADYLWYAFNNDFATTRTNGDAVVWANRGGGKTDMAAVVTLLDCIFKPGCDIRILGGSLEQSSRMYEYLVEFIGAGFNEWLKGPLRKGRCEFLNGSNVEVLTQSATSVRGRHIHKLRCDEVELFDEDVFAAAQFITQSTNDLLAALEVISTMHRPYGLMQKIVKTANRNNTPVFKWCIWEVIEKCRDRTCSRCPLWGDCRGRAKEADGYFKIDDCITQMQRSSRAAFESEMLCERPSLENIVFAEFDAAVHIGPLDYNPNLPLYRTIDFGFVNPFVCLWIQVDGDGVVRVIDEYVRTRATIDIHGEKIMSQPPYTEEKIAGTFCDPAGAGKNDVTGTSSVKELRAMGMRLRYRKSGILEGIELIRRALRRGDGTSGMVISPRAARLIEAMSCYHYPDSTAGAGGSANPELPVKDGLYDHPIDALRYFFVNYRSSAKTTSRRY
jgi:hypothetical protein